MNKIREICQRLFFFVLSIVFFDFVWDLGASSYLREMVNISINPSLAYYQITSWTPEVSIVALVAILLGLLALSIAIIPEKYQPKIVSKEEQGDKSE